MPVPLFQQRLNQSTIPRNDRTLQPPMVGETPKPAPGGNGSQEPVVGGGKITRISLPPPEEVGIRLDGSALLLPPLESVPEKVVEKTIDWEHLLNLLERKGALGHQLDRLENGYRFVIKLKGEPIIGQGRTRSEAIENALSRWK